MNVPTRVCHLYVCCSGGAGIYDNTGKPHRCFQGSKGESWKLIMGVLTFKDPPFMKSPLTQCVHV